jgi:mannose-6-phosphate isomerase-like protein (cupin superfamily)
MVSPSVFSVYDLPPVANVCNQTLREVISLPKVSMAHVIMDKGDVSLLHQHDTMTEIYFILDGEGMLHHGKNALKVEPGAYLVLPPNTPHKLRNTGKHDLEHLVFAVPPFIPNDVHVLEDNNVYSFIKNFRHDKPPVTALDGVVIQELMSDIERKSLDATLAVGNLPAGRKAIPHYHKISEEVYYVIGGMCRLKVDCVSYDVQRGSVAYVPTGTVHALENVSDRHEVGVLCLSSPSYTDGDFIIK